MQKIKSVQRGHSTQEFPAQDDKLKLKRFFVMSSLG